MLCSERLLPHHDRQQADKGASCRRIGHHASRIVKEPPDRPTFLERCPHAIRLACLQRWAARRAKKSPRGAGRTLAWSKREGCRRGIDGMIVKHAGTRGCRTAPIVVRACAPPPSCLHGTAASPSHAVDARTTTAGGLGQVHGRVGFAQKFFGIHRIGRCHDDAHGCADLDEM